MESILECDDREQPSVQPRHSRTAPISSGIWRMWNCAPEKHAPIWLQAFAFCARQGTLGCGCADAAFNSVGRTTSTSAKVDFFLVLRSADGFFNPPSYAGGYGVGLVGLIGFWFVAGLVRTRKTRFNPKRLGLHINPGAQWTGHSTLTLHLSGKPGGTASMSVCSFWRIGTVLGSAGKMPAAC